MPYVLVRSFLNLNQGFGGPTTIDYHAEVTTEKGEFSSLQNAMLHLCATCIARPECCIWDRDSDTPPSASNHNAPYCSFQTEEPPYVVLNSLEKLGYKVVAANSATFASGYGSVPSTWQIWTLQKQA